MANSSLLAGAGVGSPPSRRRRKPEPPASFLAEARKYGIEAFRASDAGASSAPTSFLSKAEMAAAAGISPRTLDKHLPARATAIGAYKTSDGRNAHWRFPADSPARFQTYLQKGEAG